MKVWAAQNLNRMGRVWKDGNEHELHDRIEKVRKGRKLGSLKIVHWGYTGGIEGETKDRCGMDFGDIIIANKRNIC